MLSFPVEVASFGAALMLLALACWGLETYAPAALVHLSPHTSLAAIKLQTLAAAGACLLWSAHVKGVIDLRRVWATALRVRRRSAARRGALNSNAPPHTLPALGDPSSKGSLSRSTGLPASGSGHQELPAGVPLGAGTADAGAGATAGLDQPLAAAEPFGRLLHGAEELRAEGAPQRPPADSCCYASPLGVHATLSLRVSYLQPSDLPAQWREALAHKVQEAIPGCVVMGCAVRKGSICITMDLVRLRRPPASALAAAGPEAAAGTAAAGSLAPAAAAAGSSSDTAQLEISDLLRTMAPERWLQCFANEASEVPLGAELDIGLPDGSLERLRVQLGPDGQRVWERVEAEPAGMLVLGAVAASVVPCVAAAGAQPVGGWLAGAGSGMPLRLRLSMECAAGHRQQWPQLLEAAAAGQLIIRVRQTVLQRGAPDYSDLAVAQPWKRQPAATLVSQQRRDTAVGPTCAPVPASTVDHPVPPEPMPMSLCCELLLAADSCGGGSTRVVAASASCHKLLHVEVWHGSRCIAVCPVVVAPPSAADAAAQLQLMASELEGQGKLQLRDRLVKDYGMAMVHLEALAAATSVPAPGAAVAAGQGAHAACIPAPTPAANALGLGNTAVLQGLVATPGGSSGEDSSSGDGGSSNSGVVQVVLATAHALVASALHAGHTEAAAALWQAVQASRACSPPQSFLLVQEHAKAQPLALACSGRSNCISIVSLAAAWHREAGQDPASAVSAWLQPLPAMPLPSPAADAPDDVGASVAVTPLVMLAAGQDRTPLARHILLRYPAARSAWWQLPDADAGVECIAASVVAEQLDARELNWLASGGVAGAALRLCVWVAESAGRAAAWASRQWLRLAGVVWPTRGSFEAEYVRYVTDGSAAQLLQLWAWLAAPLCAWVLVRESVGPEPRPLGPIARSYLVWSHVLPLGLVAALSAAAPRVLRVGREQLALGCALARCAADVGAALGLLAVPGGLLEAWRRAGPLEGLLHDGFLAPACQQVRTQLALPVQLLAWLTGGWRRSSLRTSPSGRACWAQAALVHGVALLVAVALDWQQRAAFRRQLGRAAPAGPAACVAPAMAVSVQLWGKGNAPVGGKGARSAGAGKGARMED